MPERVEKLRSLVKELEAALAALTRPTWNRDSRSPKHCAICARLWTKSIRSPSRPIRSPNDSVRPRRTSRFLIPPYRASCCA